MALIALVAMVAVSSVTYAAPGDVSVTGTLNAVNTIDECSASLALTTSGVATDDCPVTFNNNDVDGYTITYTAGGTATLNSTAATYDIDPFDELDAGCNAGAEECWSYSANSDDVDATHNFSAAEYAPNVVGDIVVDASSPHDGTVTFYFDATVMTTTPAAADYTNLGVVSIVAK